MTKTIPAVFAALCAISSPLFSQTLLDVNFSVGYVDGDLVGQEGWALTGTNPGNKLNIQSGKAVLGAGQTGEDVYKAFSSPIPATTGTSLLTEVSFSVTSATNNGDYFFHLSNPEGTSSNFYQRTFVRAFEDGFVLGLLDSSGTGSATTYGVDKLSFDSIYNVEIVWNFVEGPANDTFALYVGSELYLQHTWTSQSVAEPSALAAANLRQGGTNTTPGVLVDGLAVTAVPEPGTIAMVGLGLAAGLFGRRFRRN